MVWWAKDGDRQQKEDGEAGTKSPVAIYRTVAQSVLRQRLFLILSWSTMLSSPDPHSDPQSPALEHPTFKGNIHFSESFIKLGLKKQPLNNIQLKHGFWRGHEKLRYYYHYYYWVNWARRCWVPCLVQGLSVWRVFSGYFGFLPQFKNMHTLKPESVP